MMQIHPRGLSSFIFLGDLHVEEDSLEECSRIVDEVCGMNYDCLVQLGDLCDKNKLNAIELEALTSYVKKFKDSFKQVFIIEGNHDKLDNKHSIISYLNYMGVSILGDEAIMYTPYGDVLLGHWFTDKSNGGHGHYKYSMEHLNKREVKYGLLGHQHDFQQLTANYYHLGSARYTSFGENPSLSKVVAKLDSSGLAFQELESVVRIEDIDNLTDLKKAFRHGKVRYLFKSFKQLKEESKVVDELGKQFYQFKKKLDFNFTLNVPNHEAWKERFDVKQIIKNWLETIEDPDIRKILAEEMEKEIK